MRECFFVMKLNLYRTFLSTDICALKTCFLSRNCAPREIVSDCTSVAPSGKQGGSSSYSISSSAGHNTSASGSSSRPLQTSETKLSLTLQVSCVCYKYMVKWLIR